MSVRGICLHLLSQHHLVTSFCNSATINVSFNSIVHWFAEKLGVQLNDFIMYDPNTFYFVNGVLERTSRVERHPEILKYSVGRGENGKTADQLLQQALEKVRRIKEGQS